MFKISRNPYLRTPDPVEIMKSDFVSDEKKAQVMYVHGCKTIFQPMSWESMGKGILLPKKRGLVFLCTEEPQTSSEYSAYLMKEGLAVQQAGLLGGLGLIVAETIGKMISADKRFMKSLDSPNTFFIPYTDLLEVDWAKFGGIFGKMQCEVIKLVMGDEQHTFDYWLEGDGKTFAKIIIYIKMQDEQENFYSDFLMKETKAYGTTFTELTKGLESGTMSGEELLASFQESEKAALSELAMKGITEEDIQRIWKEQINRFDILEE